MPKETPTLGTVLGEMRMRPLFVGLLIPAVFTTTASAQSNWAGEFLNRYKPPKGDPAATVTPQVSDEPWRLPVQQIALEARNAQSQVEMNRARIAAAEKSLVDYDRAVGRTLRKNNIEIEKQMQVAAGLDPHRGFAAASPRGRGGN